MHEAQQQTAVWVEKVVSMKIGFSSLACPGWDLETIVTRAVEYGFDGVELRGIRGELHLPVVPELSARPQEVRECFAANKIELVGLGAAATLTARKQADLAKQKAQLSEL
ncbi:MAG: hypothetical protein AABZ47_06445, partial [Planctomycetota bacterium]